MCSILSHYLGVVLVYCLRSLEYVLYIVSGARSRCCILSQDLGEVAVYCLRITCRCCILSQELGVGGVYCLRR